ncbi:guanylate kinase [Helicobacter monodelphidis]|uniref:guanylate kinase n=1 Tax=Helicobacter sp. 15-1451 TaxID=2004995 RepID=UPI000DCB7900|nr:guanylate kinase [Helicobacter sp. 15-1451]RAX57394.1 guanylate kinase [Helicobacter sp. 15-1451]
MKPRYKGGILVLSGPSGAGKSSLIKSLFKHFSNVYFSVSSTTRQPRMGEIHGQHYYFISKEQFESDIKEGKFLEYARVHGNLYGTTKIQVQRALEEGKILLFDIDVQGQKAIKKEYGDYATCVFVTTPNKSTLQKRLYERGSDEENVIQKRLEHASMEMAELNCFDYILINDCFEEAERKILSIAEIILNRCIYCNIQSFMQDWNTN